MNAFKLTKRSLVSILSFSKRKYKRKSSSWSPILTSFFIELRPLFYAFLKKLIPILNAWRVNWRYYLISFWIYVRIKMSSNLGFVRDAVVIILTHVKATVFPFLWHIRYQIQQFLIRNRANSSPFFEQNHKAIASLKQFKKTLSTTALMRVNDKVMRYCPPSVKSRLERCKETLVFLWLTMITRQLTKKQTIVTLIIIVFCSMAHIKKADSFSPPYKSTRTMKGAQKDITVYEYELGGTLQTTFYNSLKENGLSPTLIGMVKEALKNRIDFKQCTDGDEYKLIWDEMQPQEQPEKAQQLTSVYFKGQNAAEPIYVFYYTHDILGGWYGKEGLPKQGGLDSPVVKANITSRFNWHRKHPILGYRRPHLGTDYAAPRGTPIKAVADGVIEEARYGLGNGRFVKIKHSPTYETEYLHMSRFKSGIKRGTEVSKKQIIGYIGMSGLTTGPHVCFRLLKNGKAIDHLTELFFTDEDHIQFEKMAIDKKEQLDKITVIKHIK